MAQLAPLLRPSRGGRAPGCTAACRRRCRARGRRSSGMSPKPALRAGRAGNIEWMSSVAVNRMLMRSSWTRSLRSIRASSSSMTRSVICCGSSSSTVVAPRSARRDRPSETTILRALNRTERLYALVEELRAVAPRPRTAAWLAERFEVSVRTIERDVLALQQAGVPMWGSTGPGGGYTIDPSAHAAAGQLHGGRGDRRRRRPRPSRRDARSGRRRPRRCASSSARCGPTTPPPRGRCCSGCTSSTAPKAWPSTCPRARARDARATRGRARLRRPQRRGDRGSAGRAALVHGRRDVVVPDRLVPAAWRRAVVPHRPHPAGPSHRGGRPERDMPPPEYMADRMLRPTLE